MQISKNIDLNNIKIEQAIIDHNVELQNFGLVFDNMIINSTNGSVEKRLNIGNNPFLLRGIVITAYSTKDGNLFRSANYAPDDKFLIQIINGRTSNLMFSSDVDIQLFAPIIGQGNLLFTPTILENNNEIIVKIRHNGVKLESDNSNSMTLGIENQVKFQVVFLGAKIHQGRN